MGCTGGKGGCTCSHYLIFWFPLEFTPRSVLLVRFRGKALFETPSEESGNENTGWMANNRPSQ